MLSPRVNSVIKSLLSRFQTLHLEYPVDMKPRYGYGKPPHALLQTIISQNRTEYDQWLRKALGYLDHLVTIQDQPVLKDSLLPGWNNGFLPGLDIVMLYTIVASTEPETYIEIGSGNSTKVVAKAKADHHLNTRIVSFDPAPRAEIDQLADSIFRVPFEKADLSIFANLKSGDIVFVDNSHRIFPNSDATVFFMDVLPYLKPGVIVHVHDTYLPYDYPQEMCDRYYSEQYALAAFLMANPQRYHTIMPNYFVSEDQQLNQMLNPLWGRLNRKSSEKNKKIRKKAKSLEK